MTARHSRKNLVTKVTEIKTSEPGYRAWEAEGSPNLPSTLVLEVLGPSYEPGQFDRGSPIAHSVVVSYQGSVPHTIVAPREENFELLFEPLSRQERVHGAFRPDATQGYYCTKLSADVLRDEELLAPTAAPEAFRIWACERDQAAVESWLLAELARSGLNKT